MSPNCYLGEQNIQKKPRWCYQKQNDFRENCGSYEGEGILQAVPHEGKESQGQVQQGK